MTTHPLTYKMADSPKSSNHVETSLLDESKQAAAFKESEALDLAATATAPPASAQTKPKPKENPTAKKRSRATKPKDELEGQARMFRSALKAAESLLGEGSVDGDNEHDEGDTAPKKMRTNSDEKTLVVEEKSDADEKKRERVDSDEKNACV